MMMITRIAGYYTPTRLTMSTQSFGRSSVSDFDSLCSYQEELQKKAVKQYNHMGFLHPDKNNASYMWDLLELEENRIREMKGALQKQHYDENKNAISDYIRLSKRLIRMNEQTHPIGSCYYKPLSINEDYNQKDFIVDEANRLLDEILKPCKAELKWKRF